MTSRLSSLLVRDGVVGVRRMEKAFQRQVLFGGALDTILLEMNELSEQRLLQYLSLATGLPPVGARELDSVDAAAAARCPRELAQRFGVVPLFFDGDALRVLTRDPVDLAALEGLASELGAPVQPFVAPEFRFELAFDRVYGRPSDARFTKLADSSQLAATILPVGRSQAVVVEAAGPVAAPADGATAGGNFGRRTMEMTSDAVRLHREETERQAAEAYRRHGTRPHAARPEPVAPEPTGPAQAAAEPVAAPAPSIGSAPGATPPAPPMPWPQPMPAAPEPAAPEPADMTEPSAPRMELGDSDAAPVVVIEYESSEASSLEPTLPLARPVEDGRPAGIVSGEIGLAEPSAPLSPAPSAPTAPLVSGDSSATAQPFRRMAAFNPAPLTAGEARAQLGLAERRDEVFEILLRAVRSRTWYVALLTVQGGAAIGRVAIAGEEVDQTDITQVLIPLDVPSSFRQAVSSASPYIGPVSTGDVEIDGMIRRMGGVIPPSALLMPLVLRNRVVALLIGHRGGDMLRIAEVSELLPLAASASDALGRIIRRGKQSRQMTAVPPPDLRDVPESIDESAATTRMPATDRHAAQPPAAAALDAEGSIAPDIAVLMAALEGADQGAATGPHEQALSRAREVLPWLHAHFPGRLDVDRGQLGGRHIRAAQHGRVLDLVVRMGPAAADLVSAKLRDGRDEIRYYALLCASEMGLPSLLPAMAERLFDSDRKVRELAVEAMSAFSAAELGPALELARRALHGGDSGSVRAAAGALAALGDVRAIPDLLDVQAAGGDSAEVATRALVALTKQDFGHSNRKWRQWWDKNGQRSRIEWLMEGLGHKDTEIRRTSAEELRKVTGEYFGYHHDLPRREREQARQRWLDWWDKTGRQRFQPVDDHDRARAPELAPPPRP